MSIEEEELGDNVADMIACSTDENLLRTPSSNVTPACSETLQRFRIFTFSVMKRCSDSLKRWVTKRGPDVRNILYVANINNNQ